MATKTRLANKTIWALEDIIAACLDARGAWRKAMERAERQMDPIMLRSLAVLSDRLAEIERRAKDAREGRYNGHVG